MIHYQYTPKINTDVEAKYSIKPNYIYTAVLLRDGVQEIANVALTGDINFFNSDYTERIINIIYFPFDLKAFFNFSDNDYITIAGLSASHTVKGFFNATNTSDRMTELIDGGEISKYYRKFKNYLDFSPYTKVILHLPYTNAIELDPDYLYRFLEDYGRDDINIKLKYQIDFLTGEILRIIFDGEDRYINQVKGKIGTEIPLYHSNATEVNRNLALVGVNQALSSASSIWKNGINGIPSAMGLVNQLSNMEVHYANIHGVDSLINYRKTELPYLEIRRPVLDEVSNFEELTYYYSNVIGYPSSVQNTFRNYLLGVWSSRVVRHIRISQIRDFNSKIGINGISEINLEKLKNILLSPEGIILNYLSN